MQVHFYSTLRQVVGGKKVDFDLPEGATAQQLLDEMIRCYPALHKELFDEQGHMYAHVHLFVNGRDASFLEKGYETVLTPEDTIGVFPAIGGGRI